jgi:hypothetical protein
MVKPLLPVVETSFGMEYSVHGACAAAAWVPRLVGAPRLTQRVSACAPAACPRRHREEIEAVFPGLGHDDLLVVPTCQARRDRPVYPLSAALARCPADTRSFC